MPRVTGHFVTTNTVGEQVRAFVPKSLPPQPDLELGFDDFDLFERANRALGAGLL
jgi:hypothetical protein